MIRCHSVSVRRSCCGPADAVAVGDVDMGLILSLEGLYQPPQSGRQALEVELQSQLDNAGLVDLGHGAKTSTVDREPIGKAGVEVLEIGVIENVERFHAELEPHPLPNADVFEQRNVHALLTWSFHVSTAGIARYANRVRVLESIDVEPRVGC